MVSCCYCQTSLQQFLDLFTRALVTSEPHPVAKQRLAIITHAVTGAVLSQVLRGMYDVHRPLLKLLYLLKVAQRFGLVPPGMVLHVASPAASAPPNTARTKPFAWLPADVSVPA